MIVYMCVYQYIIMWSACNVHTCTYMVGWHKRKSVFSVSVLHWSPMTQVGTLNLLSCILFMVYNYDDEACPTLQLERRCIWSRVTLTPRCLMPEKTRYCSRIINEMLHVHVHACMWYHQILAVLCTMCQVWPARIQAQTEGLPHHWQSIYMYKFRLVQLRCITTCI